MRLFEHGEFAQAMLRAADHFQVSEQFVEKDYYVTEILRIAAERLGDKVMFKGGTSLSKGWGLISRFSEDIDLFVNRDAFDPRPGVHKMDRILKELSEAVAEHPALTWLDEGATIGGSAARTTFSTTRTSASCRASAQSCGSSRASRVARSRRRSCPSRPWSANTSLKRGEATWPMT